MDPRHTHTQDLVEPVTYATTVLTNELGVIPSYNTSFYCQKCHTRYHHNYCVHSEATECTYYLGVPRFVQASQKFFIEASMCEIFTTMMNCLWTSTTNCARIYNQAFMPVAIKDILPSEWQPMLTCYYHDVWDAFFTYSLLLDLCMRLEVLELPHQRFQEQWNHTCDKCTHVFNRADSQKCAIWSVVTDGITLSHPCCAGTLECKNVLPNNHTVYCIEHQYQVDQCVVMTCSNRVTSGCKTCADPEHCACEDYYKLMGKAMFQLRSWLEHNKLGQTHTSGAGLDDKELLVSGMGEVECVSPEAPLDHAESVIVSTVAGNTPILCPSKPATGSQMVHVWFGWKHTHNKELCVGSCGMILGQATFYGSEGPNGIRTSSLPQGDTYFQDCVLLVDIFHYKCKHKKTDMWCTQNCNPVHWPELMHDSSWVFNLSAAEQMNTWFGGFLSIVWEMRVDRYNFFLDEMIWRCNNMIYTNLKAKGHSPYLIPCEDLLREL
ncbi:hypothetical protein K439DRAFT_1649144 [Ramaria rubella]|nr:hypothetical protein K439DRAFT_1649144 [Ramaria rubella]